MNTFDHLMFANVNIPILDKQAAAEQILALDNSVSWWDNYRYTKMIPLMTKQGQFGVTGTDNRNRSGDFMWVPHAPAVITEWFDQVVFPWIGMHARVMALITQPGVSNHEHIDCDRHELNTRQHKFRIVLQGRTDTLYFKTRQGDISAPEAPGGFVMDGSWPHGMTNSTDHVKVTLALGAPWTGKDSYSNLDIMLDRRNYEMPVDLEPFWNRS